MNSELIPHCRSKIYQAAQLIITQPSTQTASRSSQTASTHLETEENSARISL